MLMLSENKYVMKTRCMQIVVWSCVLFDCFIF